jgi:5-formyltetrahydrofolate cyclo-ligase
MTLADQKAQLRKLAYAARKTAHGLASDQEANRRLLDELGPRRGVVISGYMPIRTEVSPLVAMTALAKSNRVAVPVIAGAGLPLIFHEWTPEIVMIDGPFGARVPQTAVAVIPDVLIVPLVGFDANINRLGYGGGFYDRTLEQLRALKTIRAIGFAYSAQQLDLLPLEVTDQPLDAIVTECGVIRP